MSFISYAQNGEDVILWRALKQVEKGFYIDIGACDPSTLSVTRAFYDRGWSGINVEPEPEYHARCLAERPRDRNLAVAVAARPGRLRFLRVPGTGLSTLREDIAAQAEARGWAVEPLEVPAVTLAEICAEAAAPEIHFLKIDVEGAEQAVLEGADFTRHRPWIVVVEATMPLSTERSEAAWEPILLRAGYERALFDGVNLYFLAQEHRALLPLLAAPANALDDYTPAAQVAADQRIAALSAELSEAGQRIATLSATMAESEAAAARLHAQLDQARQELAQGERRIEEQGRQLREGAQRLRRQGEVLEKADQVLAQDGAAAEGNLPARLRAHLAGRAREISLLRSQNAELVRHRDSLLNSTSWRLTAPLRKTRTAIRVIRREPRQFVPLLLGNLRRRSGLPGLPLLSAAATEPAPPAELPLLPGNYDQLPHRDKLVAFLRADIRRQRQLLGGG